MMFRAIVCAAVVGAGAALAEQPVSPPRLMTPQWDAHYRRFLPKVDNPALQEILDSPDLILYTDHEVPPAYQDWDPQAIKSGGGRNGGGIHSPYYNIAANPDPFGNGNREFPWERPAGTHEGDGVISFRGLYLPRDEHGNLLPVVLFSNRSYGGYSWVFPVGTVFLEVLLNTDPQGQNHTFELRVRKRALLKWHADVFRPFPTAQRLADALEKEQPDSMLLAHLKEPTLQPPFNFRNLLGQTIISRTAKWDSLPALDSATVTKLLDNTVFASAFGRSWYEGDQMPSAPSTASDYHIVPKGYAAGFVSVDSHSCMSCHETVNRPVRQFAPLREWYGRIRGSDGIFSWHPFSHSCISRTGHELPVQFNQQMVNQGLVVQFDPRRHSDQLYRQLLE